MKNMTITKQDGFGNGLIKEEKVIFVENALENDVVDIKITNEKKKYSNAIIEKIVKASNQRQEALCEYNNKCGGCKLLHQKYEYQLKYKENLVKEAFIRNSYNDVNFREIEYGDEYNYRNKITLHVEDGKIGMYELKSNKLVNIKKCLLVNESINEVIEKLNTIKLENVSQVMIRLLDDNVNVLFKLEKKLSLTSIVDVLKGKNINIFGLYKNTVKQVSGNDNLYKTIDEFKFKLSPLSFFQVNDDVTCKLYNRIKESAKSGVNLLDLYCGVGTIGIYLSENYKNVIGIESINSSYLDCIYNKKLNKISNIRFINDKCENYEGKDIKFDTIVVDPPRVGLDDNTINYLLKSNASKIIYTSCDLNNLMNNLKLLNTKYNVVEVSTFDMFPNTTHVETVCVLDRK